MDDRTKFDLLAQLQGNESFYELHTHLLGMGNSDFWVNSVLLDCFKLPRHADFLDSNLLRIKLAPLVWDKNAKDFVSKEAVKEFFDALRNANWPQGHKVTWPNLDLSLEASIQEALLQDRKKGKLVRFNLSMAKDFCYDIVFDLKGLAQALNVNILKNPEVIQEVVEEKLGIHALRARNRREHYNLFKHYIVFNARKQKLKVIYGITAENLRMLIGGCRPYNDISDHVQRDARAHIINAFSMRNADGTHPRTIDFHEFRGAFTPQFFPRRFILKDSIYQQRLDLLAYLLMHILQRYLSCSPPVTYVEFSIGVGDITRPWVFDVLRTFEGNDPDHLSTCRFTRLRKDLEWLKNGPTSEKIRYKFLAGFNRQTITFPSPYSQDTRLKLLLENPQIAIGVMIDEFGTNQTLMFRAHEKSLQYLEKEIEPFFYEWVVGFDLMGDELGYPYCPFVTRSFLNFIEKVRKENPFFGIRIHGAENVTQMTDDLPGYRHYAAHMYIIFRCLEFLHSKLPKVPLKKNLACEDDLQYHISEWRGIRVGHGVAFAPILIQSGVDRFPCRKSGVLLAEINAIATSMFPYLPVEINLTSNFYLLSAPGGDSVIRTFLRNKAPVIISTDDDGVWPLDSCSFNHHQHHSLSSEFCKAITTESIINITELNQIVKNAKMYRFEKRSVMWQGSVLQNDDAQWKEDSCRSRIILHPLVVQELCGGLPNSYFLRRYSQVYQKAFRPQLLQQEHLIYLKVTYAISSICSNWDKQKCIDQFLEDIPESQELQDSSLSKIWEDCAMIYSSLINCQYTSAAALIFRLDGRLVMYCSEPPAATSDLNSIAYFARDIFSEPVPRVRYVVGFSSCAMTRKDILTVMHECPPGLNQDDYRVYIYSNGNKMQYVDCKNPHENESRNIYVVNPNPCKREEIFDLLTNNKHMICPSPSRKLYAICPHGSVATAALHFLIYLITKGYKFKIETPPMPGIFSEPAACFDPHRASYLPKMSLSEVILKSNENVVTQIMQSVLSISLQQRTRLGKPVVWLPSEFSSYPPVGSEESIQSFSNLIITKEKLETNEFRSIAEYLFNPISLAPFENMCLVWTRLLVSEKEKMEKLQENCWAEYVTYVLNAAGKKKWMYFHIPRWAKFLRYVLTVATQPDEIVPIDQQRLHTLVKYLSAKNLVQQMISILENSAVCGLMNPSQLDILAQKFPTELGYHRSLVEELRTVGRR